MARILVISSTVARGAVGLSIVGPALQALGHEVIGMPTVVLSNHPGHPHSAGTIIEASVLAQMLDALDSNDWLVDVDTILSGYLPTAEHVEFVASAVDRIGERRGGRDRIVYLCDPVLGDDPKGLYIDETAAVEIRDSLVPMADIATPNRFELEFLSRRPVTTLELAIAAESGARATFSTSIPGANGGELANLMRTVGDCAITRVPRRERAPNGTGDLFSALVLSAWLDGPASAFQPGVSNPGYATTAVRPADVLSAATAGVDFALDGSLDPHALSLSALPLAATPLRWPVEMLKLPAVSPARNKGGTPS